MSTVAIVNGVLEGLELVENLASALGVISTAVRNAQQTGTPVDLSAGGSILTAEAQAENSVLAAIAALQAQGK